MQLTQYRLARNAFEILSKLPRHGVGAQLSRTTWQDNSFWTVTEVEMAQNGKHGKAWGTLTWRGEEQAAGAPLRVNGTLKKVWRPLQGATQQPSPQWPSLASAVLQAELSAAAAAAAAAAAGSAAGADGAAEATQPAGQGEAAAPPAP